MSYSPYIFDDTQCQLGEGCLWHPLRQSLVWFDITARRIYEKTLIDPQAKCWQQDEHISAAGWIDGTSILLASETALLRFNLDNGEAQRLIALEAENPETRSNDGRADPFGGFWISTMGKNKKIGAGSIYRYYRGELTRLFEGLTIPNTICFAADASYACFADTTRRVIERVELDSHGWPQGLPQPHIDLTDKKLNPDGAVIDSENRLWNAQWGAGQIACYSPEGKLIDQIMLEAKQPSCPVFGGVALDRIFITTACEDMHQPDQNQGLVYSCPVSVRGQQEHRVVL